MHYFPYIKYTKMFNKLMKLKYNFNPILHNRIILYLFFAIALIDLMYFLNTNDMYSFSILILVGWLTSFFNKNMIVILFVSIVFTHLLKYGRSSFSEGLEGMDKDEKKDKPDKKTKKSDYDIDAKTDEFSEKLDKINAIVKTKNEKSEKHSELIDGLKDMKDTRNKIVEHVQDMQPLLEKFQGYIEKFKEYKKLNENESVTNK